MDNFDLSQIEVTDVGDTNLVDMGRKYDMTEKRRKRLENLSRGWCLDTQKTV